MLQFKVQEITGAYPQFKVRESQFLVDAVEGNDTRCLKPLNAGMYIGLVRNYHAKGGPKCCLFLETKRID